MDDFDDTDAPLDSTQPARRFHALRPVTIRQLAQAEIKEELARIGPPELRYKLDGDEFFTATFVGNIISVEVSSETTRTIRIEDGTGKITSMLTIKKDQEANHPPSWRVGAYARVFGVPRKFKEAVLFSIYSIRLVEDPHEVLFHLMEAIVVTLRHSRGQPPPRLYDSRFAKVVGPPLPLPAADPDTSILMRSFATNSPPLRSRPLPAASTSQVDDEHHGDSKDSVESDPLGPAGGVETTDTYDADDDDDDDDDGLTEYYTDPPDSPLEHSPSPIPAHPLAKNHSYEGHLDRGDGSSLQSPQSIQKPKVGSSDEEEEDGRTPRRKSKRRAQDDAVAESPEKGSDEELDVLRSEFSSQVVPHTPPRELRPDPYAGWSPTKRNLMVFIRSKTPGEEVNLKRALGEGTPKLEMRNAIKELVKEGEIEAVDGINYRLTDKGPKYPRF